MRHLHACLVHESPESVADLVRNLAYLDPDSEILLYNGGPDPDLIAPGLRINGKTPLLHPDPRPLRWGRLHDFAFDCMRFALEETEFDALTIVDSDQLATRPGYSRFVGEYLAGHPQVGMLGTRDMPEHLHRARGPALAALREVELWRPFLRRFPDGEARFPFWTFWPGTVFTRDAVRDVVEVVEGDQELAAILERTSIWATEEILLPTLVALLDYEVAVNPCSDRFVKFRVSFTAQQVSAALAAPDVYWIHPIPRQHEDPLRALIRSRLGGYVAGPPAAEAMPSSGLVLRAPILRAINQIEGWLCDDEADLLIAAASHALTTLDAPHAIVEVGSFCGRATVALAQTAMALHPDATVYAVDPHDGCVGSMDGRLQRLPPTLSRFRANIRNAGVEARVVTLVMRSYETTWDRPIALLVIDHLHDYASVARDFQHFEPSLVEGSVIAFHDYAGYFPGVMSFVHELLASERYETVCHVGTMYVLRARGGARCPDRLATAAPRQLEARPAAPRRVGAGVVERRPLVTCLMPTYDRREFVPRAIERFLRQDYERAELIVIDDGPEPIDDLVPGDPRIRHLRLEERRTIGAKRNLGAEVGRGELLANWDDDDWYAPWRLSYQVEGLVAARADICGLDRLLYLSLVDDRAWRYVAPPSIGAWLADPTFLFTRALWQRNPFPDSSMGIDCAFLWHGAPKQMLALEREEFFVGLIHSSNTSPKDTRHRVWQPLPRETIAEIAGVDLSCMRFGPSG